MTATEIHDIFERNPDSAFRPTLSSGDVVEIPHQRFTLLEALGVLVGLTDHPNAIYATRTRLISTPNIAMIEPIDRRQIRNGRRRRRR